MPARARLTWHACRTAWLTLAGGLIATGVAVAAEVATGGGDSTGVAVGVGGVALSLAGWRSAVALERIATEGIKHRHDISVRLDERSGKVLARIQGLDMPDTESEEIANDLLERRRAS